MPTKISELPQRVGRFAASRSRTERFVAVGLVLAVLGITVGFVVAGGSPKPVRHATRKPPTTTTSSVPTAVAVGPLCPLTHLPAAGGKVPSRPALLVKIGNEPDGARPQSGLNEADIIFDTPAEGFIMRYVAVYQCSDASAIGPTRSVRWVDWNMIARQFVSPILAFAGGIDPNVNGVAAQPWLSGANLLEGAQAAGTRISSRVAPDNLYTSTSALYGLFPSKKTPPAPVFTYGARPSGMTPAKSIAIDFSGGTDVVWEWDPASKQWLHTYQGSPDIDTLTNKQVTTSNIAVVVVHYQIGPYIESQGGSGDVESQLLGTGTGYVLRGGSVIPVTWHRAGLLDGLSFTGPNGQPVTMASGRTWVEIVPDVQAGGITVTP